MIKVFSGDVKNQEHTVQVKTAESIHPGQLVESTGIGKVKAGPEFLRLEDGRIIKNPKIIGRLDPYKHPHGAKDEDVVQILLDP